VSRSTTAVAAPGFGRRRTTYAILVVISIILITIDRRGNGSIDSVRRVALDVFSPVRGVSRAVARPFENAWHGVFDYDNVKQENERLREQIDAQKGVSIADAWQIKELQDLRATLNLLPLSNVPNVTAEVVGQPANNARLSFIINRGSKDGLKIGMPVITAAGLVGRLGDVSPDHAVVRLLWDPGVNVAVQIEGRRAPVDAATSSTSASPAVAGVVTTLAPVTSAAPTTKAPRRGAATTTTTVAPTTAATAATTTTTEGPATTTTLPVKLLEQGYVHGVGEGEQLVVDLINKDQDVQVGDLVSTGGDDKNLSPTGLPIGRVAQVNRRPGSTQLDVRVEPFADLGKVTFVAVIRYQPRS